MGRPELVPLRGQEIDDVDQFPLQSVLRAMGDQPERRGHLDGEFRGVERVQLLLGDPHGRQPVALLQQREAPGEGVQQAAPEVPQQRGVTNGSGFAVRGDRGHQASGDLKTFHHVTEVAGEIALVVALHLEVAVLVGDHRYHGGLQICLGHEEAVLAHADVLVEAQPVLLHERTPHELVRRQGVPDAGGGQIDDLLVGLEHGPGNRAVDTHVLAERHVGAVALGHVDHPAQRMGAEVVVGVQEEDVAAPGQPEGDVAWAARPSGVLLVDDAHRAGMLGGEPVQLLPGAVGRPVVDGYAFQFVRAQRLFDHRFQAARQIGHGVVGADDDSDR